MLERHHFDTDPLTGAVETFYYDHSNDTFTIDRTEDVTQLLEWNKFLHNNNASDWKGDMHHVASIPQTLLPDLEKRGIMDCAGRVLDEQKLKRWLNDRDNRLFRTKFGEV